MKAIQFVAVLVLSIGIFFSNLPTLVHKGNAQQNAPTPSANLDTPPDYTEQEVQIGVAFAKTRGHLLAALAVWQAGDLTSATTQLDRARTQLRLLENLTQNKQALAPLRAAVEAFAATMQPARDQAKATAAHQDVLDLLDSTQRVLLGELVDNITFKGSVVEALLKVVTQKYSSAFKDGKLVQLTEYQDAVAYVRVAGELWTDIVGGLDVDSPEAYLDIEVRFASLNIICPDYMKPPAKPISPVELEGIITTLNNALADLLLLPLFE